jgi:Ribonuclease G/E
MLSERSQTAEAIHRLKEEIDKLTNQQTEALKTATYLGMTTDEAKEYEQRSGEDSRVRQRSENSGRIAVSR